jgi:hypothetical protein
MIGGGHFHGRSPCRRLQRRFDALPIRLAVDHQVVGVAGEAINRTLRAERIGERDQPFVRTAI